MANSPESSQHIDSLIHWFQVEGRPVPAGKRKNDIPSH